MFLHLCLQFQSEKRELEDRIRQLTVEREEAVHAVRVEKTHAQKQRSAPDSKVVRAHHIIACESSSNNVANNRVWLDIIISQVFLQYILNLFGFICMSFTH